MKTHTNEVIERLEAHLLDFRAHPAKYGHLQVMAVDANDIENLLREYKELHYLASLRD